MRRIAIILFTVLLASLPIAWAADDESSAEDAIREAITILEARRAKAENKADQNKIDAAIGALQKLIVDKKAAPAKPVPPPDIPPTVLKAKLKGRSAYNPKTGELTLIYDFTTKEVLQDFELAQAKPVVAAKSLKLAGGETIRHVVHFKTLSVSSVVLVNNKGAYLRTTGGFGFASNLDYGNTQLLVDGKTATHLNAGNTNGIHAGRPLPFTLTVTDNRCGLKIGGVDLGKAISNPGVGQVELIAEEGAVVFSSLTLKGTVDPEWARKFFAK